MIATAAKAKFKQRRSEMQVEDNGCGSKEKKHPTATVTWPGQAHVAVRAQQALQELQQSQPSDEQDQDEQVPLQLQLLLHEERREP